MGEIVEISCITKNRDCVVNLYKYMKDIFSKEKISEKIEIMDNWCYENLFELDDFDIYKIKEYMESKIILITDIIADGQKGLNIEPLSKNCYNIEIWFNQKNEICDGINDLLLQLIVENMMDDIDLIAIGKEIVFDYDEDFEQIDKKSHNIDTWIVAEKFLKNKNIKTYHEYDIQKTIVGKNVIFIMSLQKTNS